MFVTTSIDGALVNFDASLSHFIVGPLLFMSWRASTYWRERGRAESYTLNDKCCRLYPAKVYNIDISFIFLSYKCKYLSSPHHFFPIFPDLLWLYSTSSASYPLYTDGNYLYTDIVPAQRKVIILSDHHIFSNNILDSYRLYIFYGMPSEFRCLAAIEMRFTASLMAYLYCHRKESRRRI